MIVRIAIAVPSALLALTLAPLATAQTVQTWSQQYDAGFYGDQPTELVADASGAVTVVGAAQTTVSGTPFPIASVRGYVLRYDTNGALLWSRNYEPFPSSRTPFNAAAAAPAGGVVAAGNTATTAAPGSNDVVVVRYDASGNELWSARYDSPGGGNELSYDVAVEPTGETWVIGYVFTSGTPDWLVLKYDASGNLLWARSLNGAGNGSDTALAIALDGQGGAYVTGTVRATPLNDSHAGIARWDASGNLLWSQEYAGTVSGETYAEDVAVDAQGDVYLAGQSKQNNGPEVFTLLKYDSAGVLQWVSAPNDPVAANVRGNARRVRVDLDGEIVVAGNYTPIVGGSNDVLVERYAPDGALRWAAPYGGFHLEDRATHLGIDSAGEIFVFGTTVVSAGGTNTQLLLLRLDPDGDVRSDSIWGDPTVGELSSGLDVGPTGSVTVVGVTRSTHVNDSDTLTVRFDSSAVPYCFGDGSGTTCPCGNASPVGDRAGCASSFGYGGKLNDGGAPSLSADTLRLFAYQMPANASALFFQGDASVAGGAGSVFGDGLRCAGGTVVRLGTKALVYGGTTFPGAGDPSVSQQGLVTAPGARAYQVWYRNSAAFCTADTFNLTNGLRVSWQL